MNEYRMTAYNTCSACGDGIQVGDRVYADSFDAVRAGRGICQQCTRAELKAAESATEQAPDEKPTPKRRSSRRKTES